MKTELQTRYSNTELDYIVHETINDVIEFQNFFQTYQKKTIDGMRNEIYQKSDDFILKLIEKLILIDDHKFLPEII